MSTQRRGLTYGKKSKHVFSHDFESLSIHTPQKSPTRLLNVSPRGPLSTQPTRPDSDDPNLFDVPLSDDEPDPPPSPALRRPPPQKTLPKLSTSPQKPSVSASAASKACVREKPTSSGKRKRIVSVAGSRPASRATTPNRATTARTARQNSAETGSERNGEPSPSHETKQTAPTRAGGQKSVATRPGKIESTLSAPFAKGVGAVLPPVPESIVETTEDSSEDIFAVPDDPKQLVSTPIKERPRKVQKVERASSRPAPATPKTLTKVSAQTHELHSVTVARPSTPTTPAMSTPMTETPSSASAAAKITTTPRQAKLWSALLSDDERSTVKDDEPDAEIIQHPQLQAEARDHAPRRRLIDTLKAAAPASDGLDLSESEMELDDDHTNHETQNIHFSQESQLAPSAIEDVQPAGQGAGPRVTYAQQRSFLQDEPQTLDELLSQPLDLDLSPAFGKRPLHAGHSTFNDDEDEDVGAMKSIHELRAAGDERRFDDDMNSLLDDVSMQDRTSLSGKRSALMDLTKKLGDPKLKNRFINRSLEYEVFNRCKNEQDPISGAALCICMVLVLTDPFEPRTAQLAWEADVSVTILQMLDHSRDTRSIARERKTNMARLAQGSVADMVSCLDTKTFWKGRTPKTISPQMLALRALEMLVRRLRESGNTRPVLGTTIVSHLVKLLPAGRNALTAVPFNPDAAALVSLELVLSIFESGSVAPACALDEAIWTENCLASVSDIITTLLNSSKPNLTDLRALSLRLCLNLANNSERNSDAFANADLIKHLMEGITEGFARLPRLLDNGDGQAGFDSLVLGLGATFNLAEMSKRVRLIMVHQFPSLLARMVGIFSAARGKAGEADSLEASQANVAYGYLAVLLGNVSQLPDGQRAVCASLPGGSARTLVEAIEEFLMHHKAVDQQGDSEIWTVFTGRLQAVADRLRARDGE